MVTTVQGTLERQGQTIYYRAAGEGPAVVLLHSFLCSSAMWQTQMEALSSRYRVVAVDLRGHGGSAPAGGPFDVYTLVEDVSAVLDELQIERAVWGGLSLGGMVAMRAALVAGDRVAGLILMDTHGGPERLTKKLKYRAMGLGAKWLGMPAMAGAILPLMFGRTTLGTRPDLTDTWRMQLAKLHVPSILQGLAGLMGRDDVRLRLKAVKVPTQILVGEEDIALPPKDSEELKRIISQAELHVIPAAGHLSSLEQPEKINGLMLDFLSRIQS